MRSSLCSAATLLKFGYDLVSIGSVVFSLQSVLPDDGLQSILPQTVAKQETNDQKPRNQMPKECLHRHHRESG
jgi:hypothetical protein